MKKAQRRSFILPEPSKMSRHISFASASSVIETLSLASFVVAAQGCQPKYPTSGSHQRTLSHSLSLPELNWRVATSASRGRRGTATPSACVHKYCTRPAFKLMRNCANLTFSSLLTWCQRSASSGLGLAWAWPGPGPGLGEGGGAPNPPPQLFVCVAV